MDADTSVHILTRQVSVAVLPYVAKSSEKMDEKRKENLNPDNGRFDKKI